ncbi:hypothetical protein L228DRAFT_103039 [Xylona heveae TC161]|uniref:DUF6594 domain-containing protein n=1 Tax=Xylona heveae (strain CBS 132557 / TC161) TaxID=1328760 RepID=A0A165ID05_XYLHT|nr:hypothetical protein L228DRAFT_103039 [Xylona heveae TC161]KZF24724.1 hypothetical protein L228DRAFT_103039 [Xylona heveae TC161]
MADKPSVFSYLEEGEENYPKTQASLNDNPDFLPMNEPRAVRRLVEADGLQHGYSKDAQSHGPSVPRSRPDSYAEATVQSENLTGSEHTQEQMPYHDYHEHRHHESVPASSNTGFHFRPIPGSYIHTPYGPSEPSFDLSPIPNPFPTNIEPHKFSSHAIATSTPQPQSPNFVSGMGIPLPPFVARPPSPTRSLSPETSKEAKDDISGYELLASKLSHDGNGTTSLQIDDTLNERRPSSGSMSSRCEKGSTSSDKEEHYSPALPPLYRKFETLNHRIFLHLQDEIAELEEDLRRIDDADAQARKFAAGYDTSEPIPSSRRADAQLLGELQMSRIDVLGRAFVKIGQYSKYRKIFYIYYAFVLHLSKDVKVSCLSQGDFYLIFILMSCHILKCCHISSHVMLLHAQASSPRKASSCFSAFPCLYSAQSNRLIPLFPLL